MSRLTRAGLLALALPSLYAGILLLPPQGAAAALLTPSPGPIDHPLHLVGADFNQDGYDDLAIANFQGGTVTILINQKNGTFLPQKDSPNIVGLATVGQPTGGPLFLAVGDIDPEDVDGDRVANDVDNCPNVYNPANCPASDRVNFPTCFLDTPCRTLADALKVGSCTKSGAACAVNTDCGTTDTCNHCLHPNTSGQCDTDDDGIGDQCEILDAACQNVDTDLDLFPDSIDNCPRIYNLDQKPERAEGLDLACNTADDNFFMYGPDGLCGTGDDKPPDPKVGAACPHSADLVIVNTSSGGGSTLGLVRVRVNDGAGGLKSRSSLQASSGAAQAVLADLNDDHRLDLVVSNSGTDALLFFPGADDGEMGFVCLGGSSAGRTCVTDSQCPGGACKKTEVFLTSGQCKGGSKDGETCVTNTNCPGGGTCRPVAPPGSSYSCLGGTNQGQTCTQDADCPGVDTRCRPPFTCLGGTNPGRSCTQDKDCAGGGVCRLPAGPEGMAVADYDGDGRQDVAVANRVAHTVAVFLNGGAAAFSPMPGSPFPAQDQPAYVLAGSLDGKTCKGGASNGATCSTDQDCTGGGICRVCDDLVVLSQGPLTCRSGVQDGKSCVTDSDCSGGGLCRADRGAIQVFKNLTTGSPVASQSIDLGIGHAPRGGALVDFDGDGNLDLAVADFTGGQVLVYSGSATGLLTPSVTLSGLASPSAVAPLNFDPDTGPNVDLAVLSYANNRVDLFRNTSSPGSLSFAPTPPAVSPWSGVSAMAIFPADASPGQDLVLLKTTPARLDVLSGTGITFRGLPTEPLSGPPGATGMSVADLRQDGLLDLLVLDNGPPGTATPLITDLTGVQTERVTVAAGNGPVQATVAPLTLHAADYDQDGVLDGVDNCPTRYNPPGCPANDPINFPECFVDIPCPSTSKAPLDCTTKDPDTLQCDSDDNGIGDQCQILTAVCGNVDTDMDGVPDYDQFTSPEKIDNCPWIANSSQSDTDGNGVGDACDGSVCVLAGTTGVCNSGPRLNAVCRADADCEAPVNDAVVVDQTGGNLAFLIGDASGSLRPAPASWTAVGGLTNPVAAVVGRFSYTCTGGSFAFPLACHSDPEPGIMVAEKGSPGSGDDALKLFLGDGLGGFAPPVPPITAQVPLQGDPTELLIAPDQRVCPNPWLPIDDLRYHFDEDTTTSVMAAVEPGTSSLAIYLPSNQGPATPPGNPNPLPLPSPPADATFVDLNQDGYLDLVALSAGDGNPATPNVTIYMGLGNGLFFTDPSLNPTDVPDGMTLLATGNVNLSTDSTYPDLVLYDSVNRSPLVMTNVLTQRADIDHSGRVDGYDLALLTRAFGSERGEDFILEPDGTLLQNPDLTSSPSYDPTRLLVGSGVKKEGQDLPSATGTTGVFICDRALQPLSPTYGLPVDLNLDGEVEGKDLAILASQFGKSY